MVADEKDGLIADIKRLMNPVPQKRYNFESVLTNKILDKLFVRLGIILIIGMLGFVAFKVATKNKNSCPTPMKRYRELIDEDYRYD